MDPPKTPKGEHYNLRWTNYLSNLSQIVFEHHVTERLVDVTLVCEGQYIKAHKLVLSACSNFFQDMFKVNSNETHLASSFIHPFIVMNGIRYNHLKHIINFMYQGEIKVIDSDLEGVLALGESLQVKGLCSVKLKQKIGVNNEVKPTEQSISPLPVQPTLPPKGPQIQVDSKINVEHAKMILPPLKNYSRVPNRSNSTSPISLNENLSLNRSQEEPRNYSKVTLDALAHNISSVQKVNNVKGVKSEEKIVKMPTVLNQPIHIDDDPEEPVNKKPKVNLLPLIIRRSDMIKVKPTTSDFVQKPKSPIIKEEKQDKLKNDVPQPFVDADKDKKSEIPRPPNAFMIFATEWRRKLSVEHPEESSKDISIRLGNLWKTLSYETKENYYQAAQAALKEHELKYPQSIPIAEPPKKKKIITVKKFENIGSSSETVDLQGDDDDLEIIESAQAVESSSQGSHSTSLST